MREIQLTQGKFTIVDDEDYEKLKDFKWWYSKIGYAVHTEYISLTQGSNKIYMHRLILETPLNMCCDHINGNRLDNRKCNLRIVTKQQNQWNRSSTGKGSSKHKGVYFSKQKNKWLSKIQKDFKEYHIGFFATENEAVIAYNKKAVELFGEYAKLNII